MGIVLISIVGVFAIFLSLALTVIYLITQQLGALLKAEFDNQFDEKKLNKELARIDRELNELQQKKNG